MRHIQTMHPGYNRKQAVVLELPTKTLSGAGWSNVKATVQSIKHELQALPELAGMAVCDRNIAYDPHYSWNSKNLKF